MDSESRSKAISMNVEELKREAHALIDRLPDDDLSWHRLAYHFGVRGLLEQRLSQGETNGIDTATLRQRLGLSNTGGNL